MKRDFFQPKKVDSRHVEKIQNIKQLFKQKELHGDFLFDKQLNVFYTLTSTENLEEVYGNFDISFSQIVEAPNLKIIHGDFSTNNSIKYLDNLERVDGSCFFGNSINLQSIESIKIIGGNLYLPLCIELKYNPSLIILGDVFVVDSYPIKVVSIRNKNTRK